MKERPILFQPDLVRAIFSGRKTETRRPVESGRVRLNYIGPGSGDSDDPANYGYETDDGFAVLGNHEPDDLQVPCPFGRAGVRLWVRETWGVHWMYDDVAPARLKAEGWDGPPDSSIWYAATDEPPSGLHKRWRPSIHMPRWACRLVLPIAEVRVERLQSITEEGAVAEGKAASVARWWACMDYEGRSYDLCGGPPDDEERARLAACIERTHETTARDLFAQTWSDIYGKQDGLRWADNPWVWVVRWNHADILTGADARPEST